MLLAYKYGNREQIELLPSSINDYISSSDPVRAYDAFVDALDFSELGIEEDPNQVGNTQYDPRAMVKLFVYGYSYSSDRSSRKLERALYHNNSFIWLMGGLKPDHKTISNFRKNNKEALEKIFKQSVRMCLKLGLIKGNTLFVDGTKIRANASMNNTWNENKCKSALEKIDKKIQEMLNKAEELDNKENSDPSLVKLEEGLVEQEKLRDKMLSILEELNKEDRKSINTTDKDCVSTRGVHGSYAGYNGQIATDEENGLIASCEVVSATTDQGLLSGQIERLSQTMEKSCDTVVVDAGYSDSEDIDSISTDVNVLVPIQRQKDERFTYNEKDDTFTCPEGHVLEFKRKDVNEKRYRYKIADGEICKKCKHFGKCTTSNKGRNISRSFYEHVSERIKENFESKVYKEKYKLRGQKS